MVSTVVLPIVSQSNYNLAFFTAGILAMEAAKGAWGSHYNKAFSSFLLRSVHQQHHQLSTNSPTIKSDDAAQYHRVHAACHSCGSCPTALVSCRTERPFQLLHADGTRSGQQNPQWSEGQLGRCSESLPSQSRQLLSGHQQLDKFLPKWHRHCLCRIS